MNQVCGENDLPEIQRLTRAYARFWQDARGLGHVLGGGLLLFSLYLVDHVRLGVFGRLGLGAAPFAWIYCRSWLRDHYYQASGRVVERQKRWEQVVQSLLTGIVALVSLAAAGFLSYGLWRSFSWWSVPGSVVCLLLLLAMPFLVWRHLRAPYEFVVGTALFALSGLLLSGSPLIGTAPSGLVRGFMAMAKVVALVMVLVGVTEHASFLKLRRRMRVLTGAA